MLELTTFHFCVVQLYSPYSLYRYKVIKVYIKIIIKIWQGKKTCSPPGIQDATGVYAWPSLARHVDDGGMLCHTAGQSTHAKNLPGLPVGDPNRVL